MSYKWNLTKHTNFFDVIVLFLGHKVCRPAGYVLLLW